MTTLTRYIQHPRDWQLHACREKMGVCEEIKRDTDLHAIIWFTIILLTVPSPSSFLKKQRASTDACLW